MLKLTREEIIEKLIDDDIDTINSQQATDYCYNILKSGFKGYDNYTNEELINEFEPRFAEEGVKIV